MIIVLIIVYCLNVNWFWLSVFSFKFGVIDILLEVGISVLFRIFIKVDLLQLFVLIKLQWLLLLNLVEMFLNKGFVLNCMVIFVVEINELFLEKY